MLQILIADDEEIERKYLVSLFAKHSDTYKVIGEACNGREVFELTAKNSPDIIIMDINMPGLIDSGLDMVWVDAQEGSFAAPATVNVVKGCKNPELAQLFVEYLICKDTQDKVAEVLNEAPVNKNASMPDALKSYLAFGEASMAALKEFDDAYITNAKAEWIDVFQRTVTVQ